MGKGAPGLFTDDNGREDQSVIFFLPYSHVISERLVEMAGLRTQHKVIDLTRAFGTAETLVETRINCNDLLEKVCLWLNDEREVFFKDTALVYLLKRYPGRTLVFTNSVDAGRRLYGILRYI